LGGKFSIDLAGLIYITIDRLERIPRSGLRLDPRLGRLLSFSRSFLLSWDLALGFSLLLCLALPLLLFHKDVFIVLFLSYEEVTLNRGQLFLLFRQASL